ncbi:MAG TPA: LamG domain-containing protein [Ferruginibacter sp.]|nr:LamG domain-containing protein [Chitinophagaceae bacterium]HQW93407.1 LamG domain-containing protein [Ferruginibacter sp.]
MQKKIQHIFAAIIMILFVTACQKMNKPELGAYPADANSPTGPLRFYVAFDGTSTNPLMNAVDSIRATFPSDNPFTNATGITGAGVTGVNQKFIKYPSFNTWSGSSSITISVWFKQDGQTKNNNGTNGPSYIYSIKAVDGFHWSNAVSFLFLEGNNTSCAIKSQFVSPGTDNWFTWEGGQSIPGLCDNQWHHMVFTYDETTSSAKLYIDGVQNPNVRTWGGHGPLNLATSKISEYRVGAGPSNNVASDDWLACSFKGGLDQLRMYGVALTAAEITALYASKR